MDMAGDGLVDITTGVDGLGDAGDCRSALLFPLVGHTSKMPTPKISDPRALRSAAPQHRDDGK